MATLSMREETKVSAGRNLSFYCHIVLKDSEQILIDIEEREWVNGSYKSTGNTRRVRLEQLSYQSRSNDGIASLYSLEVRGFKKDKGLRFRSDMVHHFTKEVIDQIPDEYHNYAREAFAKEVIKLQEELTTMTNGGIQIEPRH